MRFITLLLFSMISFLIVETHASTQTIHGGHYRNFFIASGDTVVVSGDLYFDHDFQHNGHNYSSDGTHHSNFKIAEKGVLIVQGSLTIDGYVTHIAQHGRPSSQHNNLPVSVSGDILVQKDLKTNGAVQFNASPKSNLIVLGDIIKTQNVFGGRHGNASINNDIIGADQSHHYYGENTKTDSHFFAGQGASVSRITENNKDRIPQNIKDMILTYAPNTGGGKALPVNLVYFKGAVNKNNVVLKWETASEQNSEVFILLKSNNNGKKFEEIKKIKAAGNSNTTLKYKYTDKGVSYGNHIYKLVERDFDGKEQTWTQLINVSSHLVDDRVVNVYPIPCKTVLNIEMYNLGENDELEIELIHASTGQRIQVVHEEESEEYHQQLNVVNIENGIYFLMVNDNGKGVFKKEILIQH
ncbi:T9SS type A sorting domain-containing protein [Flammeovirga sp. SJP92]|uniref:T9SS type A sorting domain-containing protein n=1 Tax=Flammeovirga sp. SJP92 TaxID=1775430 RepID=UPI0015613395|nr:T9SS type A sorting domain-containing protein [Flammeovirga sp. SJP92]